MTGLGLLVTADLLLALLPGCQESSTETARDVAGARRDAGRAPVKMSPEDYALDSQHAGLDQIDRLKIWERRGARLVGIDYRQPPLSDDQGSEDELLLGVMGTSGAETLSASGNIFLGQTEAPLLIKPFVATMTQSEILTVMVGGIVLFVLLALYYPVFNLTQVIKR